jgi:hypothetical protein
VEYTNHPGTGNSYVGVEWSEMVRLQNTPVDKEQIKLFLTWQQMAVTVELSSRQTRKRWGSAWPKKKRIVLYRQSVWTFLHELAHVLTPGDHHSGMFPAALHGLYLKWKEIES